MLSIAVRRIAGRVQGTYAVRIGGGLLLAASVLCSAAARPVAPSYAELHCAVQAAEEAERQLEDAQLEKADAERVIRESRQKLRDLDAQFAAVTASLDQGGKQAMDPMVASAITSLKTKLQKQITDSETTIRHADAVIVAVRPRAQALRQRADAALTAYQEARGGPLPVDQLHVLKTTPVPSAPSEPAPAPVVPGTDFAAKAQEQMAAFEKQMAAMRKKLEENLKQTEQALVSSKQRVEQLETRLAQSSGQSVSHSASGAVARSAPGAPKASPSAAPIPASRPVAAAESMPASRTPGAQSWGPERKPHEAPTLVGGGQIRVPPAEEAVQQPGEQKLQFFGTMLSGDKDIVEDLAVWKDWASYITFNPVTLTEVNAYRVKLAKALQQEGFVFAKVRFPVQVWAYGIFLAQIDCGPLGEVLVQGNRYYSAKQIIRAISHRKSDRFDYAQVHRDLFALSSKPDLTVDTRLKTVVRDGRTVVDAELMIEDTLPVHGAVELTNTAGKTETGDWRLRTTLQHLNLTKHDDVLSLGWLTNPSAFDEINSFSGSYSLPFGEHNNLALYGGFSDSDIDDAAPELDVSGRGFYVGGSLGRVLRRTKKYDVDATIGWTFQQTENATAFDASQFEDKVDLSMLKVSLGYSDRQFDRFWGRNFVSYSKILNASDRFGSSDQEEFTKSRAISDATFTIDKIQLARFQKLSANPGSLLGRSSLFLRLDSQYTNDNLIPTVQMAMGGANSVRGYRESEASGDIGVTGTVELRLPLWTNFLPLMTREEELIAKGIDNWKYHGLQLVLFFDAGYVERNEALAGEEEKEGFSSAGAGLRLAFTEFSQIRLDVGFPFDETEDSDSARAHLSVKLQF